MGRAAGRVASGFKRIGVALAAAGVLVGAALLNIGKVGAGFEQAITNVGAVSLKSRDDIGELEAQAKQLGATTKFTATEVANGMEIMARAGFKTEEIMGGIPGVLDAAAASGLELAEVSNVVSNVLKGMGLEATEASNVADVLALASARTNSTIGTLGESMKNVASTARQLDIPLTQVVAGVAALQDVGLDASVAGSAMNTMLTKLAAPSKGLRVKMRQLGIAFEDTAGNALPFTEILGNLSKGAKKSGGNMKQVAFLAELVGLRGQKAASNLAKLFETGKLQTLIGELEEAEGSAKRMADIRMDTLTGDLLKLEAAADAVKIAIFDTQNDGVRKVVQGITKWIDANGELISQKFAAFIEEALPIIKELASIFSDSFMETIKGIAEGFGLMFDQDTNNAEQWGVIIRVLAENLGKTLAMVVAFGVAFVTMSAAVGLAFSAAFGAVEGILDAWVARFGSMVVSITEFFADLKATFTAEGLTLTEKAIAIGKQIVFGLARGIKAVATAPIDAIAELGGGAIAGLKNALGIFSPSKPASDIGALTGEGLANGLLSTIPAIESASDRMASAVVDGMSGVADDVMQSVDKMEPTFDASMMTPQDMFSMSRAGAGGGGPSPFTASDGPEAQTPQVVTGEERVARSINETVETQQSELLIRDETNRAELTKAPRKGAGKIRVQQSGAF